MNFSVRRIIILIVFLAALGRTCMASPNSGNDYVPFNVGKAGATASYEFHISWLNEKYPRNLYMTIKSKDSRNDKDRNSQAEKLDALMESITGVTVINYKENVPPKPHKGIRLYVVWAEKESGKILRQRTIYADKSRGLNLGVDGISLPSGDYVVTVRALDDDPRFDGTFKVGISVGYRWK